MIRSTLLILFFSAVISTTDCRAQQVAAARPDSGSAEVVKHFNYTKAIALKRGAARALLCPEAGGRVLDFSVDGKGAMYLEEQEQQWQPGKAGAISAGRFDYGPELVTTPHPKLWSGEWTGEIIGSCAAKLTSPRDEVAGIQLVREFSLSPEAIVDGKPVAPSLLCKQTIINISNKTQEVCHWGRSFSPSGGICLIPLGDRPSRFPSKYVMYEEGATINVRNKDDLIRERDGFLEILAPPRKPKLGFDSYAGWLGYLLPNDTLFVKRFATHPDRVYNEAAAITLSVWYPTGPRIELEPIGPRERLKPTESASFTEEWFLTTHPFPKAGQQVDLKQFHAHVTGVLTAPRTP